MTTSAREAFILLRSQAVALDGMVMHEVAGAPGLVLGVDRLGSAHAMAPVADDLVFEPSSGPNVQLREWHDGGGVRYLDLVCTAPKLSQTFAFLVDDVARRVRDEGQDAPLALRAALAEWRLLLQRAGALSDEAIRGMFGELHVLTMLARFNPLYAIETWKGPEGALHDFVSGAGDVEVKTSKAVGLDIQVSDLAQLDAIAGRPLLLLRISVVDDPNGLSMNDAVAQARDAGLIEGEVLQRLARIGYDVGLQPEGPRYSIAALAGWIVDDGFPGLRSGDVPLPRREGIRKIRYTLDLSAAGEPLEARAVEEYLQRMMSI